MKLLSKTYSAFKPIQRIISRLVTKGIIWLEKSGIYSKVLFQHHQSATSAPPYISKEEYSKEATRPIGPQKEQAEIHSYIPPKPVGERKNFSELIKDDLSPIENIKGINAYPEEQPITREQINAIKIDNQYIKALKAQMLKYGYSNQDIDTAASLIFKAKNKGIKSDRIDALAKAIIYNRIDKSVKRKPINDIKAFTISSLFSKEEKFIFHKLENLQNFPFEPIKTNEDITIEIQREKEIKLKQLFEEEQKRRSQEQHEYETMKSALMGKLKETYDKKLEETKRKLVKLNNWFVCPEIFAISELYSSLLAGGAGAIHNSMNSEV